MKKILFVCHGNICRSPMAEYVFRDMAARRGLSALFFAGSAATSAEELGNPVHPGTRRTLLAHGVPCGSHRATRLTQADYAAWDLLLGMDARNIANMQRLLGADPGRKVRRLLDYTGAPRDIADPWYTGDFEATYRDILAGCEALLAHLLRKDAAR